MEQDSLTLSKESNKERIERIRKNRIQSVLKNIPTAWAGGSCADMQSKTCVDLCDKVLGFQEIDRHSPNYKKLVRA